MNPISALAKSLFRRTLEEKGPSLTFARLCTSRHLQDLQWLVSIVLIWIVLLAVLVVTKLIFDLKILPSVDSKYVTAVIGAGAAILAWTYQSGSRRIGAVDLFACEISVICRVFIVIDYAKLCVERANKELEIIDRLPQVAKEHGELKPQKFTAEEQYTPAYDNHLSELEPLDVDVVTHVTQFYTYRKTMIDYLRAIDAAESVTGRSILLVQMIYMQFLMYESGRKAIGDLIEFEPNKAESLVNIICSELVVFQFLRTYYRDDYRGKRLLLRCEQYQEIIPSLYNNIMSKSHPNWRRAQTTAPEMAERYINTCKALGLEPGI